MASVHEIKGCNSDERNGRKGKKNREKRNRVGGGDRESKKNLTELHMNVI